MFARRGDREKPNLDWRVRLFVAAALLAMIGMGMGIPWVVWISVSFLILGLVLRFLPPVGAEEGDGTGSGVESDDEDAHEG